MCCFCLKAQKLFLYNGPEYTGFAHGIKGHPFFLADSAMQGKLVYDGLFHRDVSLGYNLADQEVYIREPTAGYFVRLLNERIQYFSIGDHQFYRLNRSPGLGSPGFYELLMDGQLDVFVFHQKRAAQSFRADEPMAYKEASQYFLRKNDTLFKISGLRSLTALFKPQSAEVRNRARAEKLAFGNNFEQDLLNITSWLNSNFTWATAGSDSKKSTPLTVQKQIRPVKVPEENKLFLIGKDGPDGRATGPSVAGFVRDAKTGESIIGATVIADQNKSGQLTDQSGYYTLQLSKGTHELVFTAPGMKAERRTLRVVGNGELNVEMKETVASLNTVIITAEKNSNTKSTAMSVERLTIKTMRQVPVVFGETDVIKILLTLPGVTSAGEAGSGFNVRGGSTDQNLILFNQATIYNPSHLFGFFSAFNSDVVKSVELYKSAIPEKYGGRLSSVLEVNAREGNSKKFSGTGGIGPLTSKLTLEGPIVKDKATYIIGGRTTYSNWLLRSLPDSRYSNSRAAFSDFNLLLNFNPDRKNSVNITGYLSTDRFKLNNDTTYNYGNDNLNLKWKHIFNNKIFTTVTVGYDHYQYGISSSEDSVSSFKLNFDLAQVHARVALTYNASNAHSLEFGVNSIYYMINPGDYQPASKASLIRPLKIQDEQGLESAVYFGDKYTISPDLSLSAGIRYSMFSFLGPQDVDSYAPGLPRDTSTITGTVNYGTNKSIAHYAFPEYRISARYALTDNSSVKFSFNTTRQFIHMLSNTTIISPTDIWKLSDREIKPQKGYQVAAGFYKNFLSNSIETSVELYFKRMENVLDYKSAARLILNEHLATDVINARGKSYGIEFLIRKNTGKFNGWLSYAYSRTLLQQDDDRSGELINKGNYYAASFDKPHVANLVMNYKFTHRISMSMNFVYTSGRPVTIPIAIFDLGGAQRTLYSERNEYRVPYYFRSDLSMMFEGNHKVHQKSHNYWSFGFYNLTARKNPYSIYFVREQTTIKGYQMSIFGTIIPFVSYYFRF